MGQNFSASESVNGRFSPISCCFLERMSCRKRSMTGSVAITSNPITVEGCCCCCEEDDSWTLLRPIGFAIATRQIPAITTPVNTFAFTMILPDAVHLCADGADFCFRARGNAPVRHPVLLWSSTPDELCAKSYLLSLGPTTV